MSRFINGIKLDKANKPHYFLDGKEVSKRTYHKRFPPLRDSGIPAASASWNRPMHSDALAVHPKQRAEAISDAEKKGVPTDFDKEGRPIFPSRQHRNAYMRAYGYFDRDGGYGDPQFKATYPDPDEGLDFDIGE